MSTRRSGDVSVGRRFCGEAVFGSTKEAPYLLVLRGGDLPAFARRWRAV